MLYFVMLMYRRSEVYYQTRRCKENSCVNNCLCVTGNITM